MKTGLELIAEERARQISVEGWTPEHDDEHVNRELALAGAAYALVYANHITPALDAWPWKSEGVNSIGNREIAYESWNPSGDPLRELAKAGALIAAEIDRLQRIK
jgi:hypothetical protein